MTPRATALLVASMLLLSSCAVAEAPVDDTPETLVLDAPAPPVLAPLEEQPEEDLEDPADVQVRESVERLELRQKVAGLVVASLAGMDAEVFRSFVDQYPVAGFLLLGGNLQGGDQRIQEFTAALQAEREYPLLLAVDQEGGGVARIPGDGFPAARSLGKGPTDATTEAFLLRNALVGRVGANVNLGLVADVSPGPSAYIHPRTFSSDPRIVGDHVLAGLLGAQPGVAQTLKHFPGHGMVFEDSHKEIPATTLPYQEWWETHALPFRAGVSEGVDLVMTAHIRVLTVSVDPASVSDNWIGILRNELGYDGVIITDDLRMLAASGEEAYQDPAATAVEALIAGNDLILIVVDSREHPSYPTYGRIIDALVDAVISGKVSEERIDESLLRVLALRQSLPLR